MAPIHLLAIVHGMWGNPSHMAELKRIMLETKSEPSPDGVELRLIVAENNRDDSTYDGIDWGGERVAEEIFAEVTRLKDEYNHTVVKFSITGYSLGGLVSRYVVGILHQRGFFNNVEPVNFNTIATPHLGLPRYPSFLSTLFARLGPKFLSRTGEQFYCVDTWSTTNRALLDVMADPDMVFYQTLKRFQSLRIYANAINDRTVPYITAAIELTDPFAEHSSNGLEIELDKTYTPLIASYRLPDRPPTPAPKPTMFSKGWFRQKSGNFALPPFLQFRFPLNIVFYVLLPALVPVFISLVVFRLGRAAHSSRSRIKLLEKENASNHDRLIHMLADLEYEVENAVADIIDDPGDTSGENTMPSSVKGKVTENHEPAPVLTALQQSMARSLNKLPLEKKMAFLNIGHNSHATIISRDLKRFEIHRLGEGIIRHWADSFVL
ncbi:lipid particle protein [Hymenopellis radicata]|nr:lipid particle protein [Hymenopellis radicata]